MAGTTPNLALYLPGGGSTGTYTPDEVADIDPVNQNFVKLDTFAGQVGVQTNQNKQFYGPAAAISAIVGMKLGDEYQESDGNKSRWRYDGSNWVNYDSGGLYLIRPTTVVNAVINSDATITPNAGVNSFSVNGCFSSRFTRYRIDYEFTLNTSDGSQFRLRSAAGVDLVGSGYGNSRIFSSGATVGSDASAGNGWSTGAVGSTFHIGAAEVYNPAIAAIKGWKCDEAVALPTNGQSRVVGSQGDLGIYDGFTWVHFSGGSQFVSSGVKRFRIYGML